MRQVVLEEPGRFGFREVSPVEPGPYEVAVRVHRIGICGTDIHAFHGRQPFFAYPRVLGHELGVEVIAVGDHVTSVRVGDVCSVEPYLNCGNCHACGIGKPNCCENIAVLGVHADGGMQPTLVVPADKLHCGNGLAFEQLALVEPLAIGGHAVERVAPGAGDRVLVIGAGPIGVSTLPFLKQCGVDYAVMDVSESRLQFCRDKMGTEQLIQAGGNSVETLLRDWTGGQLPDVIIDATGNRESMRQTFQIAAHGARIVFVGLFQGELAFDDPNFHRRELTLMGSRNALPQTFNDIIEAIASGSIDTQPWITHRIELDAVPSQFPQLIQSAGLLKGMIVCD